jgi:hypothetical protein
MDGLRQAMSMFRMPGEAIYARFYLNQPFSAILEAIRACQSTLLLPAGSRAALVEYDPD